MSKTIVITYPSALHFWLDGTDRDHSDRYSCEKRKVCDLPAHFAVPDFRKIASEVAQDLCLPTPISFMVPTPQARRKGKNWRSFVRPKHMASESFVKIDETLYPGLDIYEIYIASPEYCFLCAAREYEREKLIELGCNLCAIYVKDDNEPYLQRKRSPLTNQDVLVSYLQKTDWTKGIKKALLLAKYVLDNSGSPMESKLGTIACLPKVFGGYGIHRPKLNQEIVHNDSARDFLKREKSSCDMVWEKEKVIVEYDSDLSHLDRDQFAYDKKKYRALQMSGYHVYPMIRDDLQSLETMDALFLSLRKSLKMRKEKQQLNKYVSIRRKVFKNLFSN